MTEPFEIHGTVWKNASADLLARVVGADGVPIQRTDLSAVKYTVYKLDRSDPDAALAVTGHDDVSLDVADIIEESLQTGAPWDVDDVGYNFRHTIDVRSENAFAVAGGIYRIEYRLVPLTGQDVVVRFRVHAV